MICHGLGFRRQYEVDAEASELLTDRLYLVVPEPARYVPDVDRRDTVWKALNGLQVDLRVLLAAVADQYERKRWIGQKKRLDQGEFVFRVRDADQPQPLEVEIAKEKRAHRDAVYVDELDEQVVQV